jgi:hypothetical protein
MEPPLCGCLCQVVRTVQYTIHSDFMCLCSILNRGILDFGPLDMPRKVATQVAYLDGIQDKYITCIHTHIHNIHTYARRYTETTITVQTLP